MAEDETPNVSEDYIDIFMTADETMYRIGEKTGSWIGDPFTGFTKGLVVDSIRPDCVPRKDTGEVNIASICDRLRTGRIPGFVPYFELDYHPVGLREHTLKDVRVVDSGIVELERQQLVKSGDIHIGDRIDWIVEEMSTKYDAAERFRRAKAKTELVSW